MIKRLETSLLLHRKQPEKLLNGPINTSAIYTLTQNLSIKRTSPAFFCCVAGSITFPREVRGGASGLMNWRCCLSCSDVFRRHAGEEGNAIPEAFGVAFEGMCVLPAHLLIHILIKLPGNEKKRIRAGGLQRDEKVRDNLFNTLLTFIFSAEPSSAARLCKPYGK